MGGPLSTLSSFTKRRWSCLCCHCERRDNSWIIRNKHGIQSAIILVDHERGTLAFYSEKCGAKGQLRENPDCYCVKCDAQGP